MTGTTLLFELFNTMEENIYDLIDNKYLKINFLKSYEKIAYFWINIVISCMESYLCRGAGRSAGFGEHDFL